jgi:hypothetical protein
MRDCGVQWYPHCSDQSSNFPWSGRPLWRLMVALTAKQDPCVEQICNNYWLVGRIMSLGDDVSCLFIFVSFLLLLWFTFLPFCIDMWGTGAIMAELFTLHPLFPPARYASEFAIGHCSSHLTGHYIFDGSDALQNYFCC